MSSRGTRDNRDGLPASGSPTNVQRYPRATTHYSPFV
jgi:hypothetical protein